MKHEATTAALSPAELIRLSQEALAMGLTKSLLGHVMRKAAKGIAPAPAPAPAFKMGDRVTFKQGQMIVTANLVQVKAGMAYVSWLKSAKRCYATVPVGKLRLAA